MARREPESCQACLARSALELYVRTGERMRLDTVLPTDLGEPRACFVSLKAYGDLRGCIGTIEPVEVCLAEEIVSNAIAAGSRDPRFYPVEASELPEITYSVDVLSQPEPIGDLDGHDPKQHGLIVNGERGRGLLLPDLEGVETSTQQEQICRMKAGLSPEEPVSLFRFTVERYF